MSYIPVKMFISQFQLMKQDLNILLEDWTVENETEQQIKSTAAHLVEECLVYACAISSQLKAVNFESPPNELVENARHIIDTLALFRLREHLERLIKIIPDTKFNGRGKPPTQHFTEFLCMVDSLIKQQKYFYVLK